MARNFNGSTQDMRNGSSKLSIANPSTTNFTVTIAGWFNFGGTTLGTCAAFGSGANTSASFNQLQLGTATGNVVRADYRTGAGDFFLDTAATFTSNTWNHGAGVFVVSSAVLTNLATYLNGGNKVTSTPSGAMNTGAIAGFSIGALDLGGLFNQFGGSVADVAYWNVQLTDLEISALGNGARPYRIRPTALQGWWPLDGDISPEADMSLNNFNMTLTAAPPKSFGPPLMPFTPRWPQWTEMPPPLPMFILMPQIVT